MASSCFHSSVYKIHMTKIYIQSTEQSLVSHGHKVYHTVLGHQEVVVNRKHPTRQAYNMKHRRSVNMNKMGRRNTHMLTN